MTRGDLVRDLHALGVERGTDVLVHSSFKALGPVEGGPQTVVDALIEAVSPGGCAMFPTHTWEGNDPEHLARFDVRNTASRAVGIIPETARLTPGGVRSLHPTHSVVVHGLRAEWYAEGHEDCPTQTGAGSPYDKLAASGGHILLLGVDHERNTSFHSVEEILGVPGALMPEVGEAELVGYDGHALRRHARYHTWTERRFMVVDEELTILGVQRLGRVGQAECRLVDAARLREFLVSAVRESPRLLFA